MSSGSNDGSERDGRSDEPRPAKNLKGLLRFCMEVTKTEDVQGTEGFEPISEERRKWLEEALTSMSVSPVERLNACLTLIEGAERDTEKGTEQQIEALSELQDWVEDLDIAGDFIKLKGLRIVPGLLCSEVSEIRWRCLEMLANLAQNNPMGQQAILDLQLLPVLILLLDTDPNPTVKTKALYAMSCLMRSNEKAQRELLASDGLSSILNCLQSDEEKLQIKSTFLMSSLCGSNPAFRDNLLNKGALEKLIDFLKGERHSAVHEHFMSTLLALVTDSADAQTRCSGSNLDLKSFLCQRIRLLEGKDEFQEEKEYAEQILNILNSGQSPSPASSGSQTNMAMMLA